MGATFNNEKKETYYGCIEEIRELDYGLNFKVPLFSFNNGLLNKFYLFHEITFTLTHYTLSLTHTISLTHTHTLSLKLTHYSLIS